MTITATTSTRTWTQRENHNTWKSEWIAVEPCPECPEFVVIDCGPCQSWHYGVTPSEHDCADHQYAECISCGFRD